MTEHRSLVTNCLRFKSTGERIAAMRDKPIKTIISPLQMKQVRELAANGDAEAAVWLDHVIEWERL